MMIEIAVVPSSAKARSQNRSEAEGRQPDPEAVVQLDGSHRPLARNRQGIRPPAPYSLSCEPAASPTSRSPTFACWYLLQVIVLLQ